MLEVRVSWLFCKIKSSMVFAVADVGGFFGNPEPEMLVRWYQVGAFAPFFRAHAHIDTKRREPYLLEEPYQSMVKSVLRLRYSLLSVWYTAFRESSVRGTPVLKYAVSSCRLRFRVNDFPGHITSCSQKTHVALPSTINTILARQVF